MDTELKDLICISEASETHKMSVKEILLDALEGKLSLFAISGKALREVLVPCKDGELYHASVGEFMHQYCPLLDDREYVDVQLGQVLEIKQPQIKELIVNGSFSEVELYRHLGPARNDLAFDFWKTEREVHSCEEVIPEYSAIGLNEVHVLMSEMASIKELGSQSSLVVNAPSNTALKVIGLLMHHLAKTPKYVLGDSPNKSQVKELLLDLAEELNVSSYGLSKVDERLLSDAMRYLEEQKN